MTCDLPFFVCFQGPGGYRKQWQKGAPSPPKMADASQTPRGQYDGPDKYDEYLINLQHKNRLLKQLKAKDQKQIDLERKEQGFSLYVNGANLGLGAVGAGVKYSPRRPATKKPKTAGDYPRRALLGQLDVNEEGVADQDRAKTAPGKVHRKNWTQASVDIKTDRGERVKLKSRLALAAEYSDDFEVYESMMSPGDDGEGEGDDEDEGQEDKGEVVQESDEADEELDGDEDHNPDDFARLTREMTVILERGSDGDSDLEIDASQHNKQPPPSRHRQKAEKVKGKGRHRVHGDDDDNDDDEEDEEVDDDAVNQQLLLSIEDVKTLRRSLEANPHIRRSICKKGTDSDDDSSSSEDDIEEEDEEEIEEDIDVPSDVQKGSTKGKDGQAGKLSIEPGDMIVLDFAPSVKTSKRQVLAAKRKDDADEVHFPPRQSQENPRKADSRKQQDIVLDAGPTPRKSTSLSAQKKRDATSSQWAHNPADNISAIQKAMAAENRVATATRGQSGARTAPAEETRSKSPVLADMPKRPATVILRSAPESEEHIEEVSREEPAHQPVTSDPLETDPLLNSQNLDDLKLAMALEKVKDMDSKSQRRLLKVLGRLEESTSPRAGKATPQRRQAPPRVDAGDSDIFKGPKLAPRSKSAASSKSSSLEDSSPDLLEVIVEVASNWGHPLRVGLTEVQFFDAEGQRITLQPTQVKVHNGDEHVGSLGNIVNGKMKTTKERNMWSCEYEKGTPVLLHFQVPVSASLSSPCSAFSKIRIWNFNKSLKDLSIGIKKTRILVGGELVWEGTVDKGCGNQVFDYSTTIPLAQAKPSEDYSGTEQSSKVQEALPAQRLVKKQGAESKPREQRLHEANHQSKTGKGLDWEGPLAERLSSQMGNPNKSNSNSNGAEDENDAGLRRSIAFEVSFDPLPSKSESAKASKATTDKPNRTSANKKSAEGVMMNRQSAVKVDGHSSSTSAGRGPRKDPKRTMPDSGLGGDRDDFSSASLQSEKQSVDFSEELNVGSIVSASFNPDDPRQTIRCETRVLMRSTDDLDLPVVDDSIQIYATPRSSLDASRDKTPCTDETTPRAVAVTTSTGAKRVSLVSDQDTSVDSDDQCMLDQLKELSVGRPPISKPPWLTEDSSQGKRAGAKPKQKRPPWLDITTGEEENPRGSSRIDQADDSLDIGSPWPGTSRKSSDDRVDYDDPLTAKDPPGRRSRNQNPNPSKISVADDLEELRWRQQAAEGAVSDDDPLSPPGQLGVGAVGGGPHEKRPHQLRSHQDRSLEESWTSLSMFNKSQKGRLAPNVNLDVEGDALDTILSGRRSKMQDEGDDDSSDEFEIPIMPIGQCMTINVRTTWGDRHYVGLNGIEVFQSNGEHAPVNKITAEPKDLNVLPEYTNDPRVITNLIDGVNCTRDDTHMWLTPFTPGRMHLITVTFEHPVKIAMIRIWNYNKSRIHSFRGAKDVEISLDDTYIFKGEIARASGALQGDPSSFGDTILFTEDEEILELISRNDEVFVAAEEWFSSSLDEDAAPPTRPRTADVGEERPMTTARQNRARQAKSEPMVAAEQVDDDRHTPQESAGGHHLVSPGQPDTAISTLQQQGAVFTARHVRLNFTVTWGDLHYLGLTGLEVIDVEGDGIPMSLDMLDASPRDLNDLPEYDMDDRTLDKLIDGTNVTSSDEHMWMIPFSEGCDHVLTIDFGREVQMTGLRVWNYNKSQEDTYRGAKIVHVWLDGQQVSPSEGFLIRKGPGNCFFDFAQDLSFASQTNWQTAASRRLKAIPDTLRQSQVAMEIPSQEYIPMHMPCGFVFQLQLLSTYGDLYYIGLNGLEFYDAEGEKMELTESNIAAYPPSVNVLEGVTDDTRTPDKLIDGVNDKPDGGHMWLAPILPSMINRVYVIFDEPATVSMIKLWNYSKTPSRGVKEFGLLVDDLLVYNGILGQVTSAARGILPSLDVPTPYHTILFADNDELRRRERHTILQNQQQEQDVQMTDDHQVMAHFKNPKKASSKTVDQALRPKTSVHTQAAPRRR
ncbi:katanin-interacting protein-like [Diadema setosum]|uniref:katanin-interacting protein-like n=1 Tax=Diadema setosum TaxID=31175 RepID=UPI003B3BBC89